MLRIVAGLAAPTRGTVTLFGAAPPQESRHRFGYMPHASLLYDELSGLENLGYYAQLYGISDDAPCRAAMNEVGLDPRLERRVGQYSQGMKQRLSLARALVHSPELLLLDEPFSNVDAASADQMVTRLAAMRNAGKTILVVTHQPQLLERAADEVIRLSAGRVVERRVLRSPQPAVVYSQGGAR